MALFQKGQSGNPRGRPRKTTATHDVEKICRELANDAIDRLQELMGSDNESVALRACQLILERGYGKPRESVQIDMDYQQEAEQEEIEIVAVCPTQDESGNWNFNDTQEYKLFGHTTDHAH